MAHDTGTLASLAVRSICPRRTDYGVWWRIVRRVSHALLYMDAYDVLLLDSLSNRVSFGVGCSLQHNTYNRWLVRLTTRSGNFYDEYDRTQNKHRKVTTITSGRTPVTPSAPSPAGQEKYDEILSALMRDQNQRSYLCGPKKPRYHVFWVPRVNVQ